MQECTASQQGARKVTRGKGGHNPLRGSALDGLSQQFGIKDAPGGGLAVEGQGGSIAVLKRLLVVTLDPAQDVLGLSAAMHHK